MKVEHADTHAGRSRRALALAAGLTGVVLAVELVGGYLAHSLALWADAGHVAADLVTMVIAWLASALAVRPADAAHTYGYQRSSIIAALVNGTLMLVVVVAIVAEAVRRLAHPSPVQGTIVMLAAAIAVAVNAGLAFSLRERRGDLNVRQVRLHLFGDLGAGTGVLVAGLVIALTGFVAIDPLISIAVAGLIAFGAVRITQQTLTVLLEGTPEGIDISRVGELLTSEPDVVSVHDLHVWSLGTAQTALSAHLVVSTQTLAQGEHLVHRLEARIADQFDIHHTTIQLELCHPCDVDRGHWTSGASGAARGAV